MRFGQLLADYDVTAGLATDRGIGADSWMAVTLVAAISIETAQHCPRRLEQALCRRACESSVKRGYEIPPLDTDSRFSTNLTPDDHFAAA